MVSLRCKLVVKSLLDKMGLHYISVELGEVVLTKHITAEQRRQLNIELLNFGLELMDDQKSIIIEKVKALIIEMVHYEEDIPRVNFSNYLTEKLTYDYTYVSGLFSEVTGTTIENYIIVHKIERAKELLLYDELNLTEIAEKLHYSSVAHLSNQFKKVTGLTPTYFKKLKQYRRRITHEKLTDVSPLFSKKTNV
jgi:AraC-like DNA-binding protein